MKNMDPDSLQIYRFWLKQRGLKVPNLTEMRTHQDRHKKMHPLVFLGHKQNNELSEYCSFPDTFFPIPWVAQCYSKEGSDQFLILVFPENKKPASEVLPQQEKNLLNNIVKAINLHISDLSREPFGVVADAPGLMSPIILKNYLLKVIRNEGLRRNYKILFFVENALTYSLMKIFTYDQLLVSHPQYPGVQTIFQLNTTNTLVFLHSLAEMLSNKDLKRPVWDMLKLISADTTQR